MSSLRLQGVLRSILPASVADSLSTVNKPSVAANPHAGASHSDHSSYAACEETSHLTHTTCDTAPCGSSPQLVQSTLACTSPPDDHHRSSNVEAKGLHRRLLRGLVASIPYYTSVAFESSASSQPGSTSNTSTSVEPSPATPLHAHISVDSSRPTDDGVRSNSLKETFQDNKGLCSITEAQYSGFSPSQSARLPSDHRTADVQPLEGSGSSLLSLADVGTWISVAPAALRALSQLTLWLQTAASSMSSSPSAAPADDDKQASYILSDDSDAWLRLKQRAALLVQEAKERESVNHVCQHTLEEAMQEQHKSISQYHGAPSYAFDLAVEGEDKELLSSTMHAVPAQAVRSSAVPKASTTQITQTGNTKTKAMSAEQIRAEAKRAAFDRTSLDIRTRSLVSNFTAEGITGSSRLARLVDLTHHLLKYPQSHTVAIKAGLIQGLQAARRKGAGGDERLLGQVRETLALMGQVDPLPRKGLRILSIDGGGTRGLIAIESLRKLEKACGGKPIHELFDYVCGVSTGALLAFLVAAQRLPLADCERVYKKCSQEMFTRSRFLGASKLLFNHAYYDASVWESILKEWVGESTVLSSAKSAKCPKLGLVSCVVKENLVKNYIFRNYRAPAGTISHYPGSVQATIWQAIRASSAAPGYYEEFKIGGQVHQDGGVLTNNPAAIAVHEAKLLWPKEPIQCVVSLGTGRFEPTEDYEATLDGAVSGESKVSLNSLRTKVNAFVQSATGTEGVHTVLQDLLDPGAYYRFNPYTSEEFTLDEICPDKLAQMQFEAKMYLRKNSQKVKGAAQRLLEPRSSQSKVCDWIAAKTEGALQAVKFRPHLTV